MSAERLELLEQHGRAYGELRLAIGVTDGLEGDAAKRSRHWQSRPFRLAGADHRAGILRGIGERNPVISLAASNLIGVDVDGEAGRALCHELVPGGLPSTVVVRSGRADGGLHLWYRPPGGSRPAKIEFSGDGLEVSSDGYLVCPPAIHGDTGRLYELVPGHAPWEIPSRSCRAASSQPSKPAGAGSTRLNAEMTRARSRLAGGTATCSEWAARCAVRAPGRNQSGRPCSPRTSSAAARRRTSISCARWPRT